MSVRPSVNRVNCDIHGINGQRSGHNKHFAVTLPCLTVALATALQSTNTLMNIAGNVHRHSQLTKKTIANANYNVHITQCQYSVHLVKWLW